MALLWRDRNRKGSVGAHWNDIEVVGIESADANGTSVGNGQDVVEVLSEGKGPPVQGMLDGFGLDAGCM